VLSGRGKLHAVQGRVKPCYTAAMLPRLGTVVLLLVVASCSSKSQGKTQPPKAPDNAFTIFLSSEIKGQIEPCGCTSDPLGDIARTAALVADARANDAVLYLDGGSLLFSAKELAEDMKIQERMKADLLLNVFRDDLNAAAVGLGPHDLALGIDAVKLPRQAANVPSTAGLPIEAPKLLTAGGVNVGVFGVVAPGLVAPFGVEASDPTAAAKAAVADLRKRGAQVVVGLLHMEKIAADAIAREVDGLDFGLVGAALPDQEDMLTVEPWRQGDTWLFAPIDRGQIISRLDVQFDGGAPFVNAIGKSGASAIVERLDAAITRIEADLERFRADTSASPAFLATQQAERDRLVAERDGLRANPLQRPDKGSWFTLSQVKIAKQLSCDSDIVSAKVAYDSAVGKANLAASKGKPIPEPAAGQAGFAGIEECEFCHEEAVVFWRKTKHAGAWETLEKGGKQFDLECVKCHVTGYGMPGGSSLANNDALRDVQCEVCHQAASIHVDQNGGRKDTLVRTTPKDTCVTCHNELHSDTFDYEAYLRDVTGPGHGEEFRKQLGDGPTGLELRSAALKKAGAGVGEGCPK